MPTYEAIYEIGPGDRELAARFMARPLGPHSPDLLRLLNRLRWGPMAGKYVLVCTKRHREWVLGQLGEKRGDPVRLLSDHVFHARAEAERAVFKVRWKQVTGEDLEFEQVPGGWSHD